MRLTRPALLAAGLAFAVAALAEPALAKSSLGIGTAEAAGMPTGPLAGLFLAINSWQREFLQALNKALVAMKSGNGGGALLVGLSFLYGVFHAAGPGHGKAIISSYVLADRVQLRRGVLLSFLSAALQGAVAILVAALGWFALRGTGVSMTAVAGWLEVASFAVVALFGAWLLWRALSRILARPRRVRAVALDFGAPGLSSPALAFAGPAPGPVAPIMRPASGAIRAEVCEAEDADDCGCGRAHIADPRTLAAERFTLANAASAVVAVGIRPCWGAVSVMAFALVNGLAVAGILSVLAVSLGTAITVSAIAAASVLAKGLVMRLGRTGGRARLVGDALAVGGALVVLLLGLLLLGGALA